MNAAAHNPIIVILCSARKNGDAGHFRRADGRKVLLVAQPAAAPPEAGYAYARPDDDAGDGQSWREKLRRCNADYFGSAGSNPLGLLPAWQLYQPQVYARLWEEYGPERLYILSAGWGLVKADFLLPNYNITFSSSGKTYMRRNNRDDYQDWRMLPEDTANPVVFFGGLDYIGFFCSLTEQVKGARYIFYNSRNVPDAPGYRLVKYDTRTKTNWHYEAADAFLKGKIGL